MTRVVPQWTVQYSSSLGQELRFIVDSDFYTEVLEVIKKINAGPNITSITITKDK